MSPGVNQARPAPKGIDACQRASGQPPFSPEARDSTALHKFDIIYICGIPRRDDTPGVCHLHRIRISTVVKETEVL